MKVILFLTAQPSFPDIKLEAEGANRLEAVYWLQRKLQAYHGLQPDLSRVLAFDVLDFAYSDDTGHYHFLIYETPVSEFAGNRKPTKEWLIEKYGALDSSFNMMFIHARGKKHHVLSVHAPDPYCQHWTWELNKAVIPRPRSQRDVDELMRIIRIEPRSTKSSNIDYFSHDGHETMLVTFRNDKTYRYDQVPYALYWEMCLAESTGSFLAKHIKGRYAHTEVYQPKELSESKSDSPTG